MPAVEPKYLVGLLEHNLEPSKLADIQAEVVLFDGYKNKHFELPMDMN